MINQVIIAGRLVGAPNVVTRPGEEPRAELCIELDRFERRLNEEEVGVERTLVQARVNGERRVEAARRYLEPDRHVLIHGHLRREAEGLVVAVERYEFMEHKLVTRPLWAPKAGSTTAHAEEAPPLPPPLPAPPPTPEAKTAPKVAARPIKRAPPKVAAA